MVSAWASANRLVLGPEGTEERSDEITAIPKLRKLLVLKECIVTIDAMGYQHAIAADAQRFAQAGRGHWGVESRLHWRLDVAFKEDASRIRIGNATAIMTSLRHLCIILFNQEPSSLGIAKQRRKAGWNDDYRAKVVFG